MNNNIYETVKNDIWTPFNILNGRENLYRDNSFKILNNTKELFNESSLNTISRNYTQNCLSIAYFSKKNIDILHNSIINTVYNRSNGLYRIKRQSEQDLLIIMRSYYLQYGKNNADNISEQIQELNNMVINWSVNEIIKNIKQFDNYKETVSTLPIPLERSQLPSQKGTRVLELKTFF